MTVKLFLHIKFTSTHLIKTYHSPSGSLSFSRSLPLSLPLRSRASAWHSLNACTKETREILFPLSVNGDS